MAVNKVIYGNETLIDLTSDTITAQDLKNGVTAHDASGGEIIGSMMPSSYADDGYGNISVDNASESALRFLQSITFPDLDYKYTIPVHSGGIYSNGDNFAIKVGANESILNKILAIDETGIYTIFIDSEATGAPDTLSGLCFIYETVDTGHFCNAWIIADNNNFQFYTAHINGSTLSSWEIIESLSDVLSRLAQKQNSIIDLADIRSGAALGATAYQKPTSGIPSSDMTSAVQESLSLALTALQSHQDISGKADVSALNTEISNRINADNSLQAQIDAITSQSDVVDVVGTYAELVAYSKPLYIDDIIKVLVDSTHSSAISYYRYKGTSANPVWEYIGSQGPFYTKNETDSLLASKQATISDLTTIRSNATNGQAAYEMLDGLETLLASI